MPKHNAVEKIGLIREVYQAVLTGTESFELENIGADLAYIMGAIATDGLTSFDETRPIVKVIKEKFPEKHGIWGHIDIMRAM